MPRKVDWAADPRNLEFIGQPRYRVEHGWQQVRVLVRVQMCWLEPSIQHSPDLTGQFVIDSDSAEGDRLNQPGNRRRIAFRANQNEMNADIQTGILARQLYRVLESSASSHQRGGRKYAFPARMHDTLIDVAREAKVVGVDDQLFQNMASFMRRNFFGFARKSCISKFIWRVVALRLSYNCWFTKS